jgi:hypothetical protein
VLSEEALVFLGGLAGLGLVVLGVLELLWPTRPRPAARESTTFELLGAPRLRRWRSRRPRHAMDGSRSPYRRRESRPTDLGDLRTAFEEEPLPSSPTVDPVLDPAGAADRCFALYQAGEYAAVVGAATGAIAGSAATRRGDVARLWSILALARQAMDDRASARAALESAIAAAPLGERAAYEQQLATLAMRSAETLLARSDGVRGPDGEEDVAVLREALDWLTRGSVLAPGDAGFRELAADVERRLWPGYERVVMTLIQRQQYGAARRLLSEALDDPRCPEARVQTFRELFSGTFGGEIGQLTAQAIRSMQDARETEALGALSAPRSCSTRSTTRRCRPSGARRSIAACGGATRSSGGGALRRASTRRPPMRSRTRCASPGWGRTARPTRAARWSAPSRGWSSSAPSSSASWRRRAIAKPRSSRATRCGPACAAP